MLLERLKQGTKHQHENLERDMGLEDHLASVASYRRLLERWYGWYAPWEAMAADKAPEAVTRFMHDRWKVPLLEQDLQRLHEGKTADLPRADVRLPRNEAEWIGALYVLEGSTLGGQLISRMISERLNVNGDSGGAFFRSYGDQVGPMWREFRAFAESAVPEAQREDAVRAAQETFESIHGWLCPNRRQ